MCTPVLEACLPVVPIYCALIWSCTSIWLDHVHQFLSGEAEVEEQLIEQNEYANVLCLVHRIGDEIFQSKTPKHFWRLVCQCCFVLYICSFCAVLLANVILAMGAYDLFLHSHKYIISHISLSVDQLWFIKWKLAMIPFLCPFLFKRRI